MAAKVLVVDDEPSILRSTGMLLEDLGYDVSLVDDPKQVLATALRERPDFILQDVRMPGLDVERLVASVRAQPELARVQVVLFTAGMEAHDLAARVGAPVLEKPFRPDQLVAALG